MRTTSGGRGWRWAVGLAAVGLALGVWGLLARPSAVADEGGGEPIAGKEVTPLAYSANDSWFSHGGHAAEMKGRIDNLGYDTLKEEPPSKASAVKAAPSRLVWYSFSDGGVDSNGSFVCLCFGTTGEDLLYPQDLPADLHYTLVFANACKSATGNGYAFSSKFGAQAYVGWKDEISNPVAIAFAKTFAENLKHTNSHKRTVQGAVNAAIRSFDGYARDQIERKICILKGFNVVVDLTQ